MQTELALCLLPSGETDQALAAWRRRLYSPTPDCGGLPPLVRLGAVSRLPARFELQAAAALAWPPARLGPAPAVVSGDLLWPIEMAAWPDWRREFERLAADWRSGPAAPPSAGEPGVWLGRPPGGAAPPAAAVDPWLAGRALGGMALAVLRVSRGESPVGPALVWEELIAQRLRKPRLPRP